MISTGAWQVQVDMRSHAKRTRYAGRGGRCRAALVGSLRRRGGRARDAAKIPIAPLLRGCMRDGGEIGIVYDADDSMIRGKAHTPIVWVAGERAMERLQWLQNGTKIR